MRAGSLLLRDGVSPVPAYREVVAMPPCYAGIAFAGRADPVVNRAERRDQLKCCVGVVDLGSGRVVAFLEFETAVEEIFDVQMLPGLRFPEVVGFQKEAIHHTFSVPPA